MNRAERRRLEKAERKKATEKTLAIKPSELAQYRRDCLEEAVTGNAEVLFNLSGSNSPQLCCVTNFSK